MTLKTDELVRLPSTITAAQLAEVTKRDGGAIVEGVLSQPQLDRINADLAPYLADIDPESGYGGTGEGFFGNKTKRLEGLVQKSDGIVEAILDERLQGWVSETLSWGAEYQLNTAQLIEIWPGEPAQALHRDELLWPEIAGGPNELMASCMLALTDFTEELGATRVAPGTHRDQSLDPASLDIAMDTVPAVMRAGDALFFTGKVIHGGGANITKNDFRRGVTITHSLGWLKPEEAQTLSVTLERAKQLPPRMRELANFAGYRPFGPDAGVVSHRLDMNDPYRVLFGEERPSRTASVAYVAASQKRIDDANAED